MSHMSSVRAAPTTGCTAVPSWNRPRGSWRRFLLWTMRSLSRVCAPDPARALPCPKLLLVVIVVPFYSANVGQLVCPPTAPLDRSVSTHRRSGSWASAAGSGARPVRPAPLLCPSLAPRLLGPSASATRPASRGRPSSAAEAGCRKRDKHRRRARRSKRSMWREISAGRSLPFVRRITSLDGVLHC